MKTVAMKVVTGVGEKGLGGDAVVSLPASAKIESVVPGKNRNDAIVIYSYAKQPKKYDPYTLRWIAVDDAVVHSCGEDEKLLGVAIIEISPIDSAPFLFTVEKAG